MLREEYKQRGWELVIGGLLWEGVSDCGRVDNVSRTSVG